jgi:hypothetical protein
MFKAPKNGDLSMLLAEIDDDRTFFQSRSADCEHIIANMKKILDDDELRRKAA